jgi:transposase
LLAVIAENEASLNAQDQQIQTQDQQLQAQGQQLQSHEQQIQLHEQQIQTHAQQIHTHVKTIKHHEQYIGLLEEQLNLSKVQKFSASSEKFAYQTDLFDEVELEQAIADIDALLPDELLTEAAVAAKKTRKRGFSPSLTRVRVELTLTDVEKTGAARTFFTKVKEELEYIPAQLNVLEYWQEKAVFSCVNGDDYIIAAHRPVHPLGKCFASTPLLANIMVSKYADGLPLYRQESILKRYGHAVSRSNMAHWMIRLEDVLKPLMTLMRESQNASNYLQMDETRIQVLKEDGKTAQSDKWMWVTRGGPPGQPCVLFEYDPSRAGLIPERLLHGFSGTLQADGYAGYNLVCKNENLNRIGCWDHVRRKFVEAEKAADKTGAKKVKTSKADVGISKMRKLYLIEKKIKHLEPAEKQRLRQELSIPVLNDFKQWLDKNVTKVVKKSLTRTAIEYALNQWSTLTGYCDDGHLNISNVLAENAIRPFAIGRKAWLFADTTRGANASATCYSLIETAKANNLEPYAYILHILNHIGCADTLEKVEALLPWNVPQDITQK